MASPTHELVQRFAAARRDPASVVLEGYHPLKHALRFGAAVTEVALLDGTPTALLPAGLEAVRCPLRTVPPQAFDRLVPTRPPVPVVALAARPQVTVEQVFARRTARVLLLERPAHAGNLGAAVRVAAAADAGGVVVVGGADPWRPAAVRGAAGLQFALPVAKVQALPQLDRMVVAFDLAGLPLSSVAVPDNAVLAFGTERGGLSEVLRAHADLVVRIPMRPGVSSLNLATAVAVALYASPPGG